MTNSGAEAMRLPERRRSQGLALIDHFVAVGDIMLGDSATCVGFGFHSRYPRDVSPALSLVSSMLKRGEIVLGNLECVLTREGTGSSRLRRDQMRGDPENAAALRAAGFTALALANNHSLQHGRAAFEETVKALDAAGIDCIGLRGTDGWACSPVIRVLRSGLRVGMLGYSWRPEPYTMETPPYARGDLNGVVRDVARIRERCDAVIVSLHWSDEFVTLPSDQEVAAGRRIVDAGASIVVGHHPHVIRPVEPYNGGLICYSLGNFATDMLWSENLRRGLVLESRLSARGAEDVSLLSTRVDDAYRIVPIDQQPPATRRPAESLAETAYRTEVQRELRRQRLDSYRYTLRNAGRFAIPVLTALVSTTLKNKIGAISGSRRSPDRGAAIVRAHPLTGDDSASSMRILHVVAPARMGGLETVLQNLAFGQRARGHEVKVAAIVSRKDPSHPFLTTLASHGVSVTELEIGDRNYPGERRAIEKLCRSYEPDVMHTHGFRCDVVDGPVAKKLGIACVSTCHGFIESSVRSRFYQWAQRRALRGFDAVVAVSAPIARRLARAGLKSDIVHLAPNGFVSTGDALTREDARRLLGLPAAAPIIGFVGRLSAEKGPDVAVDVLAHVANPLARLVVVGEGREADVLRARAESLGVSERIHWCGALPNASRFLRAFDVFLLTSRTEGTPMSLLEAMAAGVPIVATRVGGVPDIVDESSAHLAESENVRVIARAVDDVLSNPDSSAIRAARARGNVETKFAVDAWLSRYDRVYGAVRRSRRKSPGRASRQADGRVGRSVVESGR